MDRGEIRRGRTKDCLAQGQSRNGELTHTACHNAPTHFQNSYAEVTLWQCDVGAHRFQWRETVVSRS